MHKTAPAQIKAAGDPDPIASGLEEGQFRAIVSVFGNKDSYGDVVMPGAFKDTLAEWEESGNAIPVYYSHQMNDPMMNIGWVVSAEETEKGLEVVGQLDLDPDAPPMAKHVHRLLKRAGGPRDFSFAYDVIDGSEVKSKDGESYFELRKLKLYEVGPTQVGANPSTQLLGVKHAAETAQRVALDLKADRTLTDENEAALEGVLASLTEAATAIKNVLAPAADEADADEASNTPQSDRDTGPATDEEPPGAGAKSQEPSRRTPSGTWDHFIATLALEGDQS